MLSELHELTALARNLNHFQLKQTEDQQLYITRAQVKQLFNIKGRTIDRLVHEGHLRPGVHFSVIPGMKHRRYNYQNLKKLFEQQV